jgi:hypothetical protein
MSIGGLLLPILATVALSIPEPDGPFIRDLAPGEGSGSLVVEILVAPDHTVQGCKVLSPISEKGAKVVCDQARRMKVRTVAKDLDGNPIYGFVTVARIARAVSAPRSASRANLDSFSYYPADLQIGVADLPGRNARERVFMTVLVDGAGSLKHCEANDTNKSELGIIACQEAARYTYPTITDRAAVPQPYARLLNVEFIEQRANAGAGQ